jgi:flagellar hook protein FlgE
MTTLFDTALAGMSRNMRGIETAAGNVANVNTDGYHAQRDGSATGAAASPESAPAAAAEAAALVDLPTSDVDLATEFVDIKLHEIGYQANGLLIKVADRMLEDTLDILA